MGHPMNITVVLHVISHGTENCSIIAGEHQYELVSSEQAVYILSPLFLERVATYSVTTVPRTR